MPKSKTFRTERTQMRLPKAMAEEVDRIVEKFPIYNNRQQFVETAIREKLEKVYRIEAGLRHEAKPLP